MKSYRNTIFAGLLFLCITCLIPACSSETPLTPSGNDTNIFAPEPDDHSALAELRRSFFEETGVYLLFSDTLRHEINGTNANGQTTYNTQMVNFNYNLTSDGNYTLRFEYYETLEEMRAAAQAFKEYYLPHMGSNMYPYAVLLLKNLENEEYSDWGYDVVTTVSNIYCRGINTGDIVSQTEDEIKSTANEALYEMVSEAIGELEWNDYRGPFNDLVDPYINMDLGELIPGWDRTQIDQLYSYGFLYYNEDWWDEMYYDYLPSSDWNRFLQTVMNTPWEEIEAQYGEYSLLMQRFEIVRNAIIATGYVF